MKRNKLSLVMVLHSYNCPWIKNVFTIAETNYMFRIFLLIEITRRRGGGHGSGHGLTSPPSFLHLLKLAPTVVQAAGK